MWYRGHRRADHPGRILRGDHEDAEDAERELRELNAGEVRVERIEVGAILRADMRPVMRDDGASERRDADREADRRE